MSNDTELFKLALPDENSFRPINAPEVSIMERDGPITKKKKRNSRAVSNPSYKRSKGTPPLPPLHPLPPQNTYTLPPKRADMVSNQYYDYEFRRSPSLVLENEAANYRARSEPSLRNPIAEGDISEDFGWYVNGGKKRGRTSKRKPNKRRKSKKSNRSIKKKRSKKRSKKPKTRRAK